MRDDVPTEPTGPAEPPRPGEPALPGEPTEQFARVPEPLPETLPEHATAQVPAQAPVVTDQVRPRLAELPGRAGSITLIVLGGVLVLLTPVVWWLALVLGSFMSVGEGSPVIETPNGSAVDLAAETMYEVMANPTSMMYPQGEMEGRPVEGAAIAPPAGEGPAEQAVDAAAQGAAEAAPADEVAPTEPATEPGMPDGTGIVVDSGSLMCTIVGPDGAEYQLEDFEVPGSGGWIQRTFTTGAAGSYTITCETDPALGEHTLILSEAPVGGTSQGSALLVPTLLAVVTFLVGVALLVFGVIRLLRVNRRRRELLLRTGVTGVDEELPTTPMHGTAAPVGLAPTGPRPSDDPRIVFTPENAFGTRRRDARPPSFVPGILTLVVGVLLLLGGPAGGLFGPIVAAMVDPMGNMPGGPVSNNGSIALPANTKFSFNADIAQDQYPTSDADWQNWQPPPTPSCTIAGPDGGDIPLEVTRESQGGQSWEMAAFVTTDRGDYTFQCRLDERYSGGLSVWAMGPVGDSDGDGQVDAGSGFAFTPLNIGLLVGAVGLVLVIIGIVLLVRASGRRHDMGL